MTPLLALDAHSTDPNPAAARTNSEAVADLPAAVVGELRALLAQALIADYLIAHSADTVPHGASPLGDTPRAGAAKP